MNNEVMGGLTARRPHRVSVRVSECAEVDRLLELSIPFTAMKTKAGGVIFLGPIFFSLSFCHCGGGQLAKVILCVQYDVSVFHSKWIISQPFYSHSIR